ncbi:hypothetical protein Q8F55_003844 [Vanrija albida]|uniref:Uncharacterized protein n=1 Tax=Vanrija albida TaxID=181172 RepID=A0ABR3Q550_9TREE
MSPPAPPRALLGVLAATAVALLAQAIPAVNKHISHETCLESTGSPSLPFLSYPLNQALCAFNVTFSQAYSTAGGRLLIGAFGGFFPSAAFALLHAGAVRGALVLLVGQLVPVCIVYPGYFAVAAPKLGDEPWPALAGVALGYLLPGVLALRSGLAYGPLAAWQVYPLYVLAVAGALSPFSFGARRVALGLAAVLCAAVSAAAHLPLLAALASGEITPADAFWPAQDTFAGAALWVFVVDYVVVVAASLALVAPRSGAGRAALLATSALLGPGAGVILFFVARVW